MSPWVLGTAQASIFPKSKNTWRLRYASKGICRWTISWGNSWRQHPSSAAAPCIDACSVAESADSPQRICHEGTRQTAHVRRHRPRHKIHACLKKAYQAVPPLDERHGRAHEPDHQGVHDQGVWVGGPGAATGACPDIRSRLQLRQALECAQEEDAIPSDLRGMGERSRPL